MIDVGKVDAEIYDEECLALARSFASTFGKMTVDELMELALDKCHVKKGHRPHVKRVLAAFVAALPRTRKE